MAEAVRKRNGTTQTVQELQNTTVMVRLYAALLPEEAKGLRQLVRDPATTAGTLSEEERQTAVEASDNLARAIRKTPALGVERSIRDYKDSGWRVDGDNIEEEFTEVQRRTFSDDVHWGRVMAFLAFSVSFAAYVASLGIKGGAESVFWWTNRVLDKNLADFMRRENGWKGFIKFYNTLHKAHEREEQRNRANAGQTAGVWDSMAAYGASIGAIGLGALVAIGVRQAFS